MGFTLSMIPFIPWAVYPVALELGFWRDEGLDMEISLHATEEGYCDSLETRAADFYPLPISSIFELAVKGEFFVVPSFFDLANGHKKILVKRDRLGALQGETFLCYSDEFSTRYFLAKYLETVGLTLHDVAIQFCDPQEMAFLFKEGEMAGCLIFAASVSDLEERTGSATVFSTADYTEPFTAAVPKERWTLELKAALPGFVRGREKAAAWIEENPDGFYGVVRRWMGDEVSGLSEKEVMAAYGQLKVPSAHVLSELNGELFSRLTRFKGSCLRHGIVNEGELASLDLRELMP